VLTLSPTAVEAVDNLLHSNDQVPDDAGLRIGTDGESLTIGIAPEPAPGDQVIEEGGARVFVDSEAAPVLDNAELEAGRQGDQIAFGLRSQAEDNSAGGG
jgi:Fe-S cluster assembly iron-binding protein IscA